MVLPYTRRHEYLKLTHAHQMRLLFSRTYHQVCPPTIRLANNAPGFDGAKGYKPVIATNQGYNVSLQGEIKYNENLQLFFFFFSALFFLFFKITFGFAQCHSIVHPVDL
jgi:hypothetical protein